MRMPERDRTQSSRASSWNFYVRLNNYPMPRNKLSNGQKLKRSLDICIHPGCNRVRGKKRLVCYTHKQMYWSNRYPIKAKYNSLKQNAKRRGHLFKLSYEEFRKLVLTSGYNVYSGKDGLSLTIDRINARKGYVPGNVQVLNRKLNSHKRNYVDYGKSPLLPGMEFRYSQTHILTNTVNTISRS